VGTLLLIVVGAVLIHPSLGSIPWMFSTLNREGLNGDAPLPGRPVVLTWPIRGAAALTVYAAACIFAGEICRLPDIMKRSWRALVNPSREGFATASMLLVSAVYFAVMVVRAIEFSPFDRYLLPLMPCASIALLLEFARRDGEVQRSRRLVMRLSWAALSILAFWAVVNTQDYWSLARARAVATRKLEAAAIPRTAIDAGMEYNYWTQLLVNGQLNWRFVKNPPGAYRPGFGIAPDVIPSYRLEYVPVRNETAPTEFGDVPYFSLFPPFHHKVMIDRILSR